MQKNFLYVVLAAFVGYLVAALFVGTPASAAPCYGAKERQVARELLTHLPAVRSQISENRRTVEFINTETCESIKMTGKPPRDIDYAYDVGGPGWDWLRTLAKAKKVDELRLLKAVTDQTALETKKK